MSRISIDVTEVQHAKLKAMAAVKGLSIKEFVLVSTLGEGAAGDDLAELEAILDKRIVRAKSARGSKRTVGDIFRRAREGAPRRSDA